MSVDYFGFIDSEGSSHMAIDGRTTYPLDADPNFEVGQVCYVPMMQAQYTVVSKATDLIKGSVEYQFEQTPPRPDWSERP